MSKHYLPLREWISFESCLVDDGRDAGKRLLDVLVPSVKFKEPKTLLLKNCLLKQPLMQFPAGTKFDEISLNEHNVVCFYIFDALRWCSINRRGYEYLGLWRMRLEFDNQNCVEEGKRISNFLYREETEIVENAFTFRDCTADFDFGIVKENCFFPSASFDVLNNTFSIAASDAKTLVGRLLIRLCLNARDISLEFLDIALAEDMIDERERNDRKRSGRRVEMPNPVASTLQSFC